LKRKLKNIEALFTNTNDSRIMSELENTSNSRYRRSKSVSRIRTQEIRVCPLAAFTNYGNCEKEQSPLSKIRAALENQKRQSTSKETQEINIEYRNTNQLKLSKSTGNLRTHVEKLKNMIQKTNNANTKNEMSPMKIESKENVRLKALTMQGALEAVMRGLVYKKFKLWQFKTKTLKALDVNKIQFKFIG